MSFNKADLFSVILENFQISSIKMNAFKILLDDIETIYVKIVCYYFSSYGLFFSN